MQRARAILVGTFVLLVSMTAMAQSYIFTYQGKLNDGGAPANGVYDIRITQLEAIDQPAGTDTIFDNVQVTNGIFTVDIPTGALILIENRLRFLEIAVRPGNSEGAFSVLSPRQAVNMVPYAGRSASAAEANYAVVASSVSGIVAIANGGTGSSTQNFVDLTTDQTVGGNKTFTGSISGNGNISGNVVNAATQLNIGGTRILSTPGIGNIFAGFNSGLSHTTGLNNSFFGAAAGRGTTTGSDNAFFGTTAGRDNTTGSFNTFVGSGAGGTNSTASFNTFLGSSAGVLNTTGFQNTFLGTFAGNRNTTGAYNIFVGYLAGEKNTTGSGNSFFGTEAGNTNTTGYDNAFFGFGTGFSNTTGADNSFFGSRVGLLNTTGNSNSFYGLDAGQNNTIGNNNSFFGRGSGFSNFTGSNLTTIGYAANVGSGDLINATAIGSRALVTQSNSLVLGGISGVNGATSDTNVGIGTTAPTQRLHVVGSGLFTGSLTVNGTLNANLPAGSGNYIQNSTDQQSTSNFNISGTGTASVFNAIQFNIGGLRVLGVPCCDNLFAGKLAGEANSTGDFNTFLGSQAGAGNTTGGFNTYVGAWTGIPNGSGSNNTIVGAAAGNFLQASDNSFFGSTAGAFNTSGSSNAFFGAQAGLDNTTGSNNTFFGRSSGSLNVSGSKITAVGSAANVSSGSLTNATAIGSNAYVSQSNSLVLGGINGLNGATSSTNVGIGTPAPGYPLDIQGRLRLRQPLPTDAANTAGLFLARNDAGGNPVDTAFIGMRNNTSVGFYSGQLVAWPLYVETDTGFVTVTTLGPAGSTQLCRNANSQIATCSSSVKYKNNIVGFTSGLDLIKRLRPVSFNWINGGMADMGLVAEEVAAVEPLLTTTNSKGEVEGVKYDRVGVVAVNAINEQQAQIEAQQKRIQQLEAELKALKELVCSTNGAASICKER